MGQAPGRAKILWLAVKGFVLNRLGIDPLGVIGGPVRDDGPGDLGELPCDSIEGGGLGQGLGLLALIARGEGRIARGVAGRQGGEVEQAAQLGVAMLAEAELSTALSGLADAEVEAD